MLNDLSDPDQDVKAITDRLQQFQSGNLDSEKPKKPKITSEQEALDLALSMHHSSRDSGRKASPLSDN